MVKVLADYKKLGGGGGGGGGVWISQKLEK